MVPITPIPAPCIIIVTPQHSIILILEIPQPPVRDIGIPIIIHFPGTLPTQSAEIVEHIIHLSAYVLLEERVQVSVQSAVRMFIPVHVKTPGALGERHKTHVTVMCSHIVTVILEDAISILARRHMRLDALRLQFLFCSLHF